MKDARYYLEQSGVNGKGEKQHIIMQAVSNKFGFSDIRNSSVHKQGWDFDGVDKSGNSFASISYNSRKKKLTITLTEMKARYKSSDSSATAKDLDSLVPKAKSLIKKNFDLLNELLESANDNDKRRILYTKSSLKNLYSRL